MINLAEDVNLSQITTYQAGIIEATCHRNTQKVIDELLKNYDLTTMQWLLIGAIFDNNGAPINLTILAKRLNTGLSYITNMLNLLESKSIVERYTSSNDNRIKSIRIVPSYEETIANIERHLRAVLRNAIYSKVSPEDFKIYLKVMTIIGSNN